MSETETSAQNCQDYIEIAVNISLLIFYFLEVVVGFEIYSIYSLLHGVCPESMIQNSSPVLLMRRNRESL